MAGAPCAGEVITGAANAGHAQLPASRFTPIATVAPSKLALHTSIEIPAGSSLNIFPGSKDGSAVVAVSGVPSSWVFTSEPVIVVYLTQTPFTLLSPGGKLSNRVGLRYSRAS